MSPACLISYIAIWEDAYALLYAHTGTYGISSKPAGSFIASSEAVDITTLEDAVARVTSFQFIGVEMYTMTGGTKYCIAVYGTDMEVGDAIRVWGTYPDPTHDGNPASSAGGWTPEPIRDAFFDVLTDGDISGTGNTGTTVFGMDGSDQWVAVTVVIEAAVAVGGWTGTFMGVTDPAKVFNQDVSGISKVMGVE